jgi:transcriptional regulator with XRE-family HTH domain
MMRRMKSELAKPLKTFGGNVRRIRIEKEVTQETLAERAALNLRTVQRIEAGQTNILITTAKRIQKALQADWNELMRF